jgi:hypothetical protein
MANGGRGHTAKVARKAAVSSCRCGQQLDCCTRQHCPRCGRSIHQP